MSNLTPTPNADAEIPAWDTSTPLLGGDGMAPLNRAPQSLLNKLMGWVAKYASATGATLLGWKSALAGTTQTTVAKKLNSLNADLVADFGADPTGLVGAVSAFTQAIASGVTSIRIPDGSIINIDSSVDLTNAAGVTFFCDGVTFIGASDMFTWTNAVAPFTWRGGYFASASPGVARAFVGPFTKYMLRWHITDVTFEESLAAGIVGCPINSTFTKVFCGAPAGPGRSRGASHTGMQLHGDSVAGTAVNNNDFIGCIFNRATSSAFGVEIKYGDGNRFLGGDIENNDGIGASFDSSGNAVLLGTYIEGNGGSYQIECNNTIVQPLYYTRLQCFGTEFNMNNGGIALVRLEDANSTVAMRGSKNFTTSSPGHITNTASGFNLGVVCYENNTNVSGTMTETGLVSVASGSGEYSVNDAGTGANLFNVQTSNGQVQAGTGSAAPCNNVTASSPNAVFASNGVFQRSTSSIKWKTDVQDLEDIDIRKWRPVRYRSTCPGDDSARWHYGFISEELDENGFPEMVHYDNAGKVQGAQYERGVPALTRTMHTVLDRLDVLEASK